MFYEGGIREPFMVRWPGKSKPGSRSDVPVTQIDLFPTLANVAGAKLPELLDGQDISTAVEGGALPARDLFWHFPAYLQSYNKSEGSNFEHFRTTPCSVIRRGDWKLIEYFEDGALELYDLSKDPSEKTNLSQENPAKRDELFEALKSWRKATQAPVPDQKNPKFEGS